MTRAVLFDVDFTLIYPGPTFQGEGYRAFCARHGVEVDAALFDRAVASAARLLDLPEDTVYDDEIHVRYTRHIIEEMGGTGDALDAIAREIYREWAACQHFELYDDVAARSAANCTRPESESAWCRTHTAASRRSSRTSSFRGSFQPRCRRRSTA